MWRSPAKEICWPWKGRMGFDSGDISTLRPVPLRNPPRTDCNSHDGLEFLHSGDVLVGALRCGRLDILSLSGEPLRVLRPPTSTFVDDPAISSDGSIVAANTPGCMGSGIACQTGVVAWDIASGNVRWSFASDTRFGSVQPAFSPDGRHIAIADKQVQLLDTKSGVLLKKRAIAYRGSTAPLSAEPHALAYAKDGRLAVGFSFSHIVEFADFNDDIGR